MGRGKPLSFKIFLTSKLYMLFLLSYVSKPLQQLDYGSAGLVHASGVAVVAGLVKPIATTWRP